jgi:hypothetical protein
VAVVRCRTALWRRLPDRVLVLAGDDHVLTLAGTAVEIWDALSAETDARDLVGSLAHRYSVASDVIEAEVHATLDQLASAGVVEAVP